MKRKILLILCLGLILVGCENLKLGQKEKTEETKQEEIKEASENKEEIKEEKEEKDEAKKEKSEAFRSFYTLPIDDFTPNLLSNYETASILRNINEGLYKIDSQGNLTMGLADSIEITEVEGYLMYDIVLKDKIKFHNGEDIKPEDVQYSFFRYAGLVPEVDNTRLENFKYWVNLLDGQPGSAYKKGRVEILGSNRIILFVDSFYGEETTSSLIANTFIIPKDYSEADQATNPIGAGPYKFVGLDSDGTLKLASFDGYYGDQPAVKEISLIKSADKASRSELFVNGGLDMVDSYPAQDKAEGFNKTSGDIYSLAYNVNDESLKDPDLRAAINGLINKDMIQQQLFGQAGQVVQGPLSPRLASSLENLELTNSFNPEASKDILAKRPELLEKPLTISYVQEDFLSHSLGEYIEGYMKSFGFTVNLEPVAYKDFIQRTSSQPDKAYQLAIFRYSGDIDPIKIFDRFTTRAARNISNYYSTDYNELTKGGIKNIPQMMNLIKEACPETFIIDPGKSYKMAEGFTEPLVYSYPYLDFSSIKTK